MPQSYGLIGWIDRHQGGNKGWGSERGAAQRAGCFHIPQKRMKQGHGKRIAFGFPFGVPLNAHSKAGGAGDANGLDDPIGGGGFDGQIPPQGFDGLRVQRIHPQGLAHGTQGGQKPTGDKNTSCFLAKRAVSSLASP